MPGWLADRYYAYSPTLSLGTKVDVVECTNTPGFGPEVRAVVTPPDLYAGGLIKVRHWTFFPDAAKVLWVAPTFEAVPIDLYAWWVPNPWDFAGYFASVPATSSATHTMAEQVKAHPLVTLVPDPAAGAWADGKLLYLWYSVGLATTPNEFSLLATEILWGL